MPETMDFVHAGCLVCGSTASIPSDTIAWRDQALHYVLCSECGLKYMSPRPTRAWYLKFYETEFWDEKVEYRGFTHKQGKQALAFQAGLQKQVDKQHWRADRIRQLIQPHHALHGQSIVLDIGAAFGITLKVLREQYGCEVMAVEPSQLAREFGGESYAIPYVGRYMEDLYAPQPFDGRVSAILMSHVLENISDPRAALTAARRLLRADGLIYIDTSNFYYNNAVNPYHPYIFNADTLTDLLAQAGFRVVAQHGDPVPPHCAEPNDPYLVLIAQPGASNYVRKPVDAQQLVKLQEIGLARYKAVRKQAKGSVYRGSTAA